jgi:hypothetical protein
VDLFRRKFVFISLFSGVPFEPQFGPDGVSGIRRHGTFPSRKQYAVEKRVKELKQNVYS